MTGDERRQSPYRRRRVWRCDERLAEPDSPTFLSKIGVHHTDIARFSRNEARQCSGSAQACDGERPPEPRHFDQHGEAVAGNHEAIAERKQAEIGIVGIVRPPAIKKRIWRQVLRDGFDNVDGGAPRCHDIDGTPILHLFQDVAGGSRTEAALSGGAAEEHDGQWPRQVVKARLPDFGGLGEPLLRDGKQRQPDPADIGSLRRR